MRKWICMAQALRKELQIDSKRGQRRDGSI